MPVADDHLERRRLRACESSGCAGRHAESCAGGSRRHAAADRRRDALVFERGGEEPVLWLESAPLNFKPFEQDPARVPYLDAPALDDRTCVAAASSRYIFGSSFGSAYRSPWATSERRFRCSAISTAEAMRAESRAPPAKALIVTAAREGSRTTSSWRSSSK
jgi:hypothetical protein